LFSAYIGGLEMIDGSSTGDTGDLAVMGAESGTGRLFTGFATTCVIDFDASSGLL
jgi:hypothetical protein